MDREKFWDFVVDYWLSLLTVAIGLIATALSLFSVLNSTLTLSLILFIVSLLATTEIVERYKRLAKIEDTLVEQSGSFERNFQQFRWTIFQKMDEETKQLIQQLDQTQVRNEATSNLLTLIEAELKAKRHGDVSLIVGRNEIYDVSNQIVGTSTFHRLWTTAIGESAKYAPDKWFQEVAKLLRQNKAEHKRVVAIRSEADIEDIVKRYETDFEKSPRILVSGFVKRQGAIDVFIADDQEVMLGLSTQATSPNVGMDSCIRIRNTEIVSTVASWYDQHLWPSAIPIIGTDGINLSGIERLKEELKQR